MPVRGNDGVPTEGGLKKAFVTHLKPKLQCTMSLEKDMANVFSTTVAEVTLGRDVYANVIR